MKSAKSASNSMANVSRKRKTPTGNKENESTAKRARTDTTSAKRKATKVIDERPPKRAKTTGNEIKTSKKETALKPAGRTARKAATKPAEAAKKSTVTKSTRPKPSALAAPQASAGKKAALKSTIGPPINFAPTQALDIFICGSGESGELGLGNKKVDGKKPVNVKRPRLHHFLSADKVGVVQVACGGMHTVVLTKDNLILTWGVNDQGALGRNTAWDGGLRDADDGDSGDEEGFEVLNPRESTPAEVDNKSFAPGTKFVKVVASDSASFALTEDGRVYGWGTFRSSDGILGFTKDVLVQKEPALLPESKKITDIATGSNHVMTLDIKGKVETWGAPEQNQLGRRVVQRDMKASALRPGGLRFSRGVKIAKIACGSYHSFAIDNQGRLYAWGLNNFGELGVEGNAGEDGAVVLEPTLVESLAAKHRIKEVSGGEHHSIACTEDGLLFAWGRIDGKQTGLTADKFNEDNCIFDVPVADKHGVPRILKVPTVHEGLSDIVSVTCGTDNSFAVTSQGKVYSWGFSANYQTGQGEQDDDVEVPTVIDNTAVRDRKLVFAGAGGQFSVLASVHE